MEEIKYGLVLSGGGVRGAAHIGAIKALEEYGISPSVVSGSSAGAVVGALYAAGYDWQQILAFFHSTNMFSIRNFPFRKTGLIDSEKFTKVFKKHFPEDSFEKLKKKLYITASDMISSKMKFFHQGELIKPLLASAAFPGVFSPIRMHGTIFADGGITNNFPVEPLLAECDQIIGVYVNPIKKVTVEELSSSVSLVERAYNISRATISMQKFESCQMVISPEELNRFGTFSMSHVDEIFQLGYEAAVLRIKAYDEQKSNLKI